ncbi:hypothetical protein [Amycolatopsis sp. NPDC051903]|uniref:hypothetical protein n=1 Tax=Amycolatopsis sp. NPDC051903 TaxID=3363936 RepID=UPI0037A56AAE
MRWTVLVAAMLVLLTGCSHVVAGRLVPTDEQRLLGALLTADELNRLGLTRRDAPVPVTRQATSPFSAATPCAQSIPSDSKLVAGVHVTGRNLDGRLGISFAETIARYESTTGAEVVAEARKVLGCRTYVPADVVISGPLTVPRVPGLAAQAGYCQEQTIYRERECSLFAAHGDFALVARFRASTAMIEYPQLRDALAKWLDEAVPAVEAAFLRA